MTAMVPGMPGPPASVKTVTALSDAKPRHDRFVDVDVRPGAIEIGDDDDRRARGGKLTDVGQGLRDDAGDRRDDGCVGDGLLPGGDLDVGGRDRARGRRRPLRGARRRAGAPTFSAAARIAVARRPDPLRRHIPSRHRIVALLARARVRGEERFEAGDVGLRRRELGVGGAGVGLGGRDLCLGLTDVLGARAGAQQPQLGVRLVAFGPRPRQPELRRRRCRASRPGRRP